MENIQRYCTTKPIIPPYDQRFIITTTNPRLSLRPFQIGDLAALHVMRSQIEVMKWTYKGTIDTDVDTTKAWMERFMDPSPYVASCDGSNLARGTSFSETIDTKFNFVIVYTPDPEHDSTPDTLASVIGSCGVHQIAPDYECGYMIRKEFWGRGIVTAALTAFLQAWWALPRMEMDVSLEAAREALAHGVRSDVNQERTVMRLDEVLGAVIDDANTGSRRVAAKCGFQFMSRKTIRERDEDVSIAVYTLTRPGPTSPMRNGY